MPLPPNIHAYRDALLSEHGPTAPNARLVATLFRVRNKDKTVYCYSETERDKAVKELGGKPEITRFKGLGEISPKEFAQFIGKQMRLSKVEYAPRAESVPIFDFYMGKNTPERKDYIMDSLVVPVEE